MAQVLVSRGCSLRANACLDHPWKQPARVGGHLLVFAVTWAQEVTDDLVCSMVSRGCKLEFRRFLSPHFMVSKVSLELQKIAFYIASYLYQRGESSHGFYSNPFTVPKPNRDTQPILYLKGLNKFLKVQKLRIETTQSAIVLLHQGDVLVDIMPTHHDSLASPTVSAIHSGGSSLSFLWLCLSACPLPLDCLPKFLLWFWDCWEPGVFPL